MSSFSDMVRWTAKLKNASSGSSRGAGLSECGLTVVLYKVFPDLGPFA